MTHLALLERNVPQNNGDPAQVAPEAPPVAEQTDLSDTNRITVY